MKRINKVSGCFFWLSFFLISSLFFVIIPEIIQPLFREFLGLSAESLQPTGEIPISVRYLFKNKFSPGSVSVGVAEGNLTPQCRATAIYQGHIDPGNFAVNRGFCSWNKSTQITVEEADFLCLNALLRQSIVTENNLFDLGLSPGGNKKAIVMGSDLWNQSNSAGPNFAQKFKIALLDKGLIGEKAYIWARVESFRNSQNQLDASGLFGICRREEYYKKQLAGLVPFSEEWRWNCIALDQGRRVREILKVLQSPSCKS